MKKTILTALGCLLLASLFPTTAFAQELIVGGQAVGIRIRTEGVLVSGVAQVETEEGGSSPAAEAGLQEGDCVLRVDGKEVHSAAELIGAVGSAGGDPVELTVRRGERLWKFFVQPVLSDEGQWMLGMWLRDAVTGIGTVTFCDPDSGTYGALGHSITDEVSGKAVPLETGSITAGPASIVSTVEGSEQREYAVEVNRVYRDEEGVHAMLSVTDAELLGRTGGIVQGMSGSPIIQNGKLVGAVTHVFVSNPARGYAVGIQDMLESAGLAAEKAA